MCQEPDSDIEQWQADKDDYGRLVRRGSLRKGPVCERTEIYEILFAVRHGKEGVTLHFVMSEKSSYKRGVAKGDIPPSISLPNKTALYRSE